MAVLAGAVLMGFVPTTDPDASRTFYRDVLGLALLDDGPFGMAFAAPAGSVLRVQVVAALTPQPFTVAGWLVPDVRQAIAELAPRGVTFARFDGVPQDDAGVWTAPDGTGVAWFHDPAGNLLSLTQTPTSSPVVRA